MLRILGVILLIYLIYRFIKYKDCQKTLANVQNILPNTDSCSYKLFGNSLVKSNQNATNQRKKCGHYYSKTDAKGNVTYECQYYID